MKFRRLIPALCMLLLSAVLASTSTYAWFSMNTEVIAKNMQVKAVAAESGDARSADSVRMHRPSPYTGVLLSPLRAQAPLYHNSSDLGYPFRQEGSLSTHQSTWRSE